MSENSLGFETLQVRGNYDPKDHNYSVAVPIYQTASFDLGGTDRLSRLITFSEPGFFYTRIGNPTSDVLEKRVAALEGGTAAIALASGMAAVAYALLNVAEGGGEIVAVRTLYAGSFNLFHHILPSFGIKVNWVEDPYNLDEFREAITPNTKAVFAEAIGNPLINVLDIEKAAEIAHSHDIPLIVDNTFTTPHLLRPLEHGADIVVHSATKALGGHGTTIAGVIVENGKFNWGNGKFPHFTEPDYNVQNRNLYELLPTATFTTRIRLHFLQDLGAAISPFDAYLILLGIETLSVRVDKLVRTTEKIVSYLQGHPQVSWVNYPTVEDNKSYKLAKKYLPKGAGSIFTFGFKGSEESLNKFIDSLKLFSFLANVGDARSLVIRPFTSTHFSLNEENRVKAGAYPEAVRLSIGLESSEDLIADLEQAFAKAGE